MCIILRGPLLFNHFLICVEKIISVALFCLNQAERIKDEANKLMQQHRSLMDDINRQKQDAERLLERGIEQQQV